MVKRRLESVCNRLRRSGSRVTPQRLAIVEAVFGSQEHPTAAAVYEQVHGQYPTMSLTTVYKTLHMLESLGEVKPVLTDAGTTHYDANVSPHVHAVCARCGAVADADAGGGNLVTARAPHGWTVAHWRLELVGLCPRCVAEGNTETTSIAVADLDPEGVDR